MAELELEFKQQWLYKDLTDGLVLSPPFCILTGRLWAVGEVISTGTFVIKEAWQVLPVWVVSRLLSVFRRSGPVPSSKSLSETHFSLLKDGDD